MSSGWIFLVPPLNISGFVAEPWWYLLDDFEVKRLFSSGLLQLVVVKRHVPPVVATVS